MSTPERKALAEAITRFAYAQQQVAQNEATLQKANARLSSLFAESAELSEHDAAIEAKRTEGFKMALINDEPILMQEPPGYASVHLRKERCASEIQATQEGIKGLEAELEAARAHVDECDNAIELCRERVFCAEAEQLAQKFMERLDDLRRMSHKLRFMASRQVRLRQTEANSRNTAPIYWGNEKSRQIGMKGFVVAACHENVMGDSDLRGNIKVRERISAEVSAYWSALKTDASAVLSEEVKEGLFRPRVRSDVSDVSISDASLKEPAE
jgi:uncharacterized protein (DUF3084 family)